MSATEFLAFERAADTRHELVNGVVYAMAGGSAMHALIAANVAVELGLRLRGKGCQPFSGDLRIKIEETGMFTYPDLSIVCGALEFATADDGRDTVTNPTLLVEVLSPSTEGYDRGEKFAHYRRIPSLKAFLLVDQFRPRLELFIRVGDGFWRLSTADGLDNTLEIEPLSLSLPLAEVYRGATFATPPPRH
jgi:Uma2 family endonuclease